MVARCIEEMLPWRTTPAVIDLKDKVNCRLLFESIDLQVRTGKIYNMDTEMFLLLCVIARCHTLSNAIYFAEQNNCFLVLYDLCRLLWRVDIGSLTVLANATQEQPFTNLERKGSKLTGRYEETSVGGFLGL